MRTVNKKMSWVLGAAALLTAIGTIRLSDRPDWVPAQNEITRKIRERLAGFMEVRPEDRVYLQTDRPFYQPGDDIWFSAWVRDGMTLKPSGKSDIVTVDLIGPKGNVEKQLHLIAKGGLAAGDFSLSDEMPGGIYKLRAYTEWMKNDGEDRCFEKEVQVQEVVLPALKMKLDFVKKAYGPGDEVMATVEVTTNENRPLSNAALRCEVSLGGKQMQELQVSTDEKGNATVKFNLPGVLRTSDGLLNVLAEHNGSVESISRSVPIVRNQVELGLYPEGGDLVAGLPSRVAFRAVNEFGKAADLEGELVDERGTVVSTFSSLHMGMGSFRFTPAKNKTYYVRITRPTGIEKKYGLPEVLERGMVMQVESPDKNTARVRIASTETGEMSLVAQMRGKVLFSTAVPLIGSARTVEFPTSDFPMGVMQVTLFDSKGIARAERLMFVNRDRRLSVSIKPDKEKYLPREKVRLNILVKDERGLPAPALLSLAVVNDQLLSFADDRSGNILSRLLLQDDIKEKVEEPAFYFDKKQPKAKEALDHLMMTAGWRRFTWEQVLEQDIAEPVYSGKRAAIGGKVIDGYTVEPVEGAVVMAGGKKHITGKNGECTIKGIELYEPVNVTIEKTGYQRQVQHVADYGNDHTWYLYDNRPRPYYSRRGEPPMEMEAADALAPMANMGAGERSQVQRFKKSVAAADNREEKREVPVLKKQAAKNRPALNKDVKHKEGKPLAMAEKRLRAGAFLPQATAYYRARTFAAPLYKLTEMVDVRTDFRNTIYWNPRIDVGHDGRHVVEFYASDDITSYRAVAEGMSPDGMAGRGEQVFFTQLPFQLLTKIPAHLTGGDEVQLPVTLKNNTAKPLGGILHASLPSNLEVLRVPDSVQTIMPGAAKTLYFACRVKQGHADTSVTIGFRACALSDELSAEVKIRPRGFPAKASFSGQYLDREFTFEARNVVDNSLRISFSAYPDVISDLMKGVEGILREPYGCFEQTSCTAYPNAMVLNYLKSSGSSDSRLLASAGDLLDRGYKRLTTFETPQKGYEWFGASPAHEGLTAYGIMEFADMKRAGQKIDEEMLDRTARWLLNHRDGKGGFTREKRALHDFGRISEEVMNGYIVYALADAGYNDIVKEYAAAAETAGKSGDAYLMALSANAAFSLGKKAEGNGMLASLQKKQADDGSFTGSSHSITYSQGRSLGIETTALAIMAMLASEVPDVKSLENAVRWLLGMRDGSGAFSSTQGTILALKALTSYAVYNKRVKEDGEIVVYVDGKKVAVKQYRAGDRGELLIAGLEKFVRGEGKHTIRVKYFGVKQAMPYSVSADWNTTLPQSDDECALNVKATVLSKEAQVGETVRLNVVMSNKRSHDLPSAMAVVGIPAGLSVQPWQLKELQEKHVFDYYEINGDKLALYYRGVGPAAVHEIGLDLKAEMPGEFNCPATSAYLYYTNEFKTWSGAGMVKVTAKNEKGS